MSAERLATRAISPDHPHVALCGGRAVAWYRLEPVRWHFRSEPERAAMVAASAQRLALLQPRRVTFRVTTRPSEPGSWAERTLAMHEGLPFLGVHTRHISDHLARFAHSARETYCGIEVSRSPLWALGKRVERHASKRLNAQVSELNAIAAGPGWDARPALDSELAWLYRRSLALGCSSPVLHPGDFLARQLGDDDSLQSIRGEVHWRQRSYEPLWVDADLGDHGEHRCVVVAMLGHIQGDLDLTEPALSRLDRVPFPVEAVMSVHLQPPERTRKEAQRILQKAQAQISHHGEHNLPPPPRLAEQGQQSLALQDALDHGGELDTRCRLWLRLAVSAESEEEARQRAEKLRQVYGPKYRLPRPPDQHWAARAFIPSEPLPARGPYMRRMDVRAAASFMPQASAQIGHPSGVYIGYTAGAGGQHPVFWETHRATEQRERSGLALICGGLGAGKSSLGAQIVVQSVGRRVRWFVLDPSSRMGSLCALPEFEGLARHVDLLEAAPGILNPYSLVPDPNPRLHPSVKAWRWADQLAQGRRRTLTADVLAMFLPAAVAGMPETMIALKSAVREVAALRATNPRQVLDRLWDASRSEADPAVARHSRILAQFLGDVADEPSGQLIFPSGDDELDYRGQEEDCWLTVISMRGLQLPDERKPRSEWTSEETAAIPRLYLAGWLVQRAIYEADPHEPKGALFEEAHVFAQVPSGKLLLRQSSRDSRKHNARIILSSQDAVDLLEAGVGNWLDAVFVGRTDDPAAQAAGLAALRVPAGCGYEPILGSLSPHSRHDPGRSGRREFVMADGEDGVERVVVDLGALLPHVRAAIDTTPDHTRVQSAL